MPEVRSRVKFTKVTLAAAIIGLIALAGSSAFAQEPINDLPNPYRTVENWAQFPDGRAGAVAAVTVEVETAEFGAGDQAAGEQEVKEALELIGDALQIGEDVIIKKFLCAPFAIAGVIDVPAIAIEDVFPPTNTANIVIADRELAKFSDADITVTVV